MNKLKRRKTLIDLDVFMILSLFICFSRTGNEPIVDVLEITFIICSGILVQNK